MDNKHATPIDLAYLAGLFDGEGCIAIQKCRFKNGSMSYGVNVKVTNTDSNLIEKIQSIYLSLNINPLIRTHYRNQNNSWKDCFDIYLTKRDNIKILLEAILPYLVGKRARAILMLRFIAKEIDRETGFGEMKRLNQKGEPSETTREAPLGTSLVDEDIVHANSESVGPHGTVFSK